MDKCGITASAKSTGATMVMKTVSVIEIAVALLASPPPLRAQAVIARDGWEAFPNVGYQGGDAT